MDALENKKKAKGSNISNSTTRAGWQNSPLNKSFQTTPAPIIYHHGDNKLNVYVADHNGPLENSA